ncbi:pirin family protein [Nitratidesulfovibrio termitidis]|uniref:pirin family protein n=1 Tax=Nitratidesulfovibrio termitidis TaxID=42252 RepID=UPI0003FB8778|nr:pirin-like bicupin family protein [Nitratidesulfovibrio termitidis]
MRLIDSRNMGRGKHGWLDSHFHFSFAEYYNPDNMQFGVLRVLNDDTVAPGTGFGPHAHADMEILSYVIDGELTHADSMGNERTLTRGQVQYMSAGTGVRHSEYNHGKKLLRFLQIWILPDRKGYAPQYGDHRFAFTERVNNWLPIATGVQNSQSTAPIKIHADINAYATSVSQGQHMEFSVSSGRQAYLVMIEGQATINGTRVSMRDAVEIVEENIFIHPESTAHMLIIEMAKA